jgi:putative ABC transport system permease protein
MQNVWQDLRYGARMLLKSPGFTTIAVLTLALGIGANTAIFSVVNAVLLRPLPYAAPERLVALWESDHRKPSARGSISYPNFFDWRAQNHSFESMASYYTSDLALTTIQTSVNVRSAVVSSELFSLLGIEPQLGRRFLAEEERPQSSTGRAAIISDSLWRRQFGADRDVVGRSIALNGKPFSIVGVMPAAFQFPIDADRVELWITSAIDGEKTNPKEPAMNENRGSHFLAAIGRLKPNVSIDEAGADMDVIGANLEQQYPDSNTYHGVRLVPYHNDVVHDYRAALWLILGAVGCVLLIACVNVANLLLARATTRYREIAVRSALGASRARIVGQLLTESVLLAFAGGFLGLLFAWWGTEAVVKLVPEDLPRLAEINIDLSVFAFTLLTSMTTGIVFGLAPALQASKIEMTDAMKEGARGGGVSRRRARLRAALVVSEIAIAIVVLIGAGLLLRTFSKLQRVDLGYDASHVLTASVELPDARYPKPEQAALFYERLLANLRALPGVDKASAIVPQPLSGDTFVISFEVEGRDIPKGEHPSSHFRSVTPDYFDTMKIPVVAGRPFTERDTAQSAPVLIVNESFARRQFPDENPIGKHVKPGISLGGESVWREVVGVVKDVKHRPALGKDYEPEYYVPHAQMPISSMSIVLRTNGDPRGLASVVQEQVEALDREIPVHRVRTLEQYLGNAVAQPRFNALLLTLFAGLALVLTAIGLYGVMAYSVIQRTPEIGVRIALGAQTTSVLKLVIGQGLKLTALGLVIGLGAAYGSTRFIEAFLFGVAPTDPLTFAGIALLLSCVAVLACYVPARRATKVDPMVALRCE